MHDVPDKQKKKCKKTKEKKRKKKRKKQLFSKSNHNMTPIVF